MKKFLFILCFVVCGHFVDAFAQGTLSQEFLVDNEEAASIPDKDKILAAEESAKKLLQQRPQNLRKKSFPKLRSSVVVSTNQTSNEPVTPAPFGLIWGANITQTTNQGVELTPVEEKDYPNSFAASNLPKELQDFARVDVSFGEENKLWRIIAYSTPITDNADASKILKIYETYANLLNKKYGNKQQFFNPAQIEVTTKNAQGREVSEIKDAPIGNPQFLAQLQSGEAELYSTYNNQDVGAALAINVDGEGKSYIVIDYKNLNLLKEKEQQTLDAL